MLRKFALFVFLLLPCICWAGNESVGVDAETNIATIEESIKINEAEFDSLVEQVKEMYPDFDWNGFNNLNSDTKRMVLKNYLAKLAFEQIKENYIQDVYARSKDGVIVEKDADSTVYVNKSDELYRTSYVTHDDLVKKLNVSNKCDGCNFVHFKQTDVKNLDKLIAQEIAAAPAETYCEKVCLNPDKQMANSIQTYEFQLKSLLKNYNKVSKEYLLALKKNSASAERLKEEEQEIANNINQVEQYISRIKKMPWRYTDDPYSKDCDMVLAHCFNVEHIPETYERFELKITGDDEITQILYGYDDVLNNIHTESDAFSNCSCYQNDIKTLTQCECSISFGDFIQDFSAVRKWENQDRIDIKNGMLQDRDEKGFFKHEWASNKSPGGYFKGRGLDLFGSDVR